MLKKSLLGLAAAALAGFTAMAQSEVPAFPGAEGFARYTTTGGRGGTVYHVTNLDDSGEGSLRWALGKSGARTIVFDVSGTIELKSDLKVSNSNVSVLGQTAPGEGITIAFYTVNSTTHNVIFRFIRFRRSQVKNINDGADAAWGRNRNNIIFDHCTFSWSIDELASFYDNKNFTMQWCALYEGLNEPGHSKGAHSYGGIWGGKGASFHHTFIAHAQNRTPRFNGARYNWNGWDKNVWESCVQAERVDFRNCVMYNWGSGGCYGGPGGGYINMVNNYYKAGPGTANKTRVTQVTVGAEGNSSGHPEYWGLSSRYFVDGNYVEAADEPANYDWNGVVYDGGLSTIDGEKYIPDPNHYFGSKETYVKDSKDQDCVRLRLEEAIDAGDVTTHTAEKAYEKVLNFAGASLFRDDADRRVMEEARTGTVTYNGDVPNPTTNKKSGRKGIVDWINDPADPNPNPGVPSFPTLKKETRPEGFDTDGDGIPDSWEILNGLDPNDPTDGNLYTIDTEKGWYTNLEVYANSLVEHIVKAGNADAINAVDEYYPSYVADPAGIENITASEAEIIGFEYYDLNGVRLAEPTTGINIRRIIYSDGTVKADKVLKKY
ncbi:MAG: hypothetical protein NC098_01530 [Lachnoclostridium sp.]|nr:hypothetical protein [Lachnoclostridium sp.]